jgi:hypothetical protein
MKSFKTLVLVDVVLQQLAGFLNSQSAVTFASVVLSYNGTAETIVSLPSLAIVTALPQCLSMHFCHAGIPHYTLQFD